MQASMLGMLLVTPLLPIAATPNQGVWCVAPRPHLQTETARAAVSYSDRASKPTVLRLT